MYTMMSILQFLCIQCIFKKWREFFGMKSPMTKITHAGGNFSQVESFNFTRSSRDSCVNVTLPLSQLDPLTDTEFSADILVPAEPVFHLGPVSSAVITVEAIEGQNTAHCIYNDV